MKIGIFSFAHMHAESYVRCVAALPGVELLGIADDDAARGAEFARRHATRFYPSYAALLADRNLGGLCLGIREQECEWDVEDADAVAATIPARYAITYRTLDTDLSTKG